MTEFPDDAFWGEEDIDDTRRHNDKNDDPGVGIDDGSDGRIVNFDASRKSLNTADGIEDEGRLLFIVVGGCNPL
jgi:hypothetical protein